MNLYLKKENLYLKIAWIKRIKNGSIIGWNMCLNDLDKNFPKGIESLEVHYHFPIKGKGEFHYSYKYVLEGLKYSVRAYKNILSIKVDGDITDIQEKKIKLPVIENFREFFFIKAYKNIELENPKYFQQIINTSFNIWTDRISNYIEEKGKNKSKIQKDDLIIDINLMGKSHISYGPFLYNSKENVCFDSLINEHDLRYIDDTGIPIIDFIVHINNVTD